MDIKLGLIENNFSPTSLCIEFQNVTVPGWNINGNLRQSSNEISVLCANICSGEQSIPIGKLHTYIVFSVLGKFLAKERGHEGIKLTVKPSFGNLILWKTIYEDNGYYYVDAVRLLSEVENCPGTRIKKLNVASDFPNLKQNSQQSKDIKRFYWFSCNYNYIFDNYNF